MYAHLLYRVRVIFKIKKSRYEFYEASVEIFRQYLSKHYSMYITRSLIESLSKSMHIYCTFNLLQIYFLPILPRIGYLPTNQSNRNG